MPEIRRLVDYQLADALNDLSGHNRLLDDMMIFAARDLIFVIFVVAALSLLPLARRRDWWGLARVAGTLGLAFVLGLLATQLYAEPRPFTAHHDIHRLVMHAPGQSFPSDHATAAFAVALAVLIFASQRWGWCLLVAATVIGLARVYVGVHYPGDIAGSLVVAVAAALVVQTLSAAASRRRGAAGVGPQAV